MDRQGFDPITKTYKEVIAFMERIKDSEESPQAESSKKSNSPKKDGKPKPSNSPENDQEAPPLQPARLFLITMIILNNTPYCCTNTTQSQNKDNQTIKPRRSEGEAADPEHAGRVGPGGTDCKISVMVSCLSRARSWHGCLVVKSWKYQSNLKENNQDGTVVNHLMEALGSSQ